MILAIDTSGSFVCVVVADETGRVRSGAVGRQPRAHAEEIAPLVAATTAGVPVSRVVAGRGPGSFTGLRVGLAFAQMWGWAQAMPVTGVCSLDAVAAQNGLADGWVVTDARRGELFAARYAEGVRVGDPLVATRADVATLVAGAQVVGDTELLVEPDRRATGSTVIDPAGLAVAAARAVREAPQGSLQPDYLRRPDVTVRTGA